MFTTTTFKAASNDPACGWPAHLYASIGRTLSRYRIEQDGSIQVLTTLELPVTIQYACFHPQRPILYVACSNGGVASAGDRHCLVQIGLDQDTLYVLTEPIALPYRPLHGAVSLPQAQLALAYNRPAAVSIHPLDVAGFAQPAVALLEGTDLVGHFPHQIIPVPHHDAWLLTCRGDNATPSNPENPGSLRLLTIRDHTARCTQVIAPEQGYGFGPRNSAFHPLLPVLYVVLERQNQLAAFRCLEGMLDTEPVQTMALLEQAEKPRDVQLAGAIVVHPTGRFAYVVNRAHPASDGPHSLEDIGENSVVVFELDERTGAFSIVQRMPLIGIHARCLSLSQDGSMLVVAIRQALTVHDAEHGQTPLPAGFACFHVQPTGHLSFIRHHVVDVRHEQLFWAEL